MNDDDTFAAACRRADEKQLRKPVEKHMERLRRLLETSVSDERAYGELNIIRDRAASATVEALMFSLRERGTRALEEPDTRRRLSELSKEQLAEVGDRLQRLKPKIARAWNADEINTLVQTYGRLRCR
jgi:hypothetical protein